MPSSGGMVPGLESVPEPDFDPYSENCDSDSIPVPTGPVTNSKMESVPGLQLFPHLESDPWLESVPLLELALLNRKRRVPRLNNHYICIKIKSQSSIIC